MKPCPVCGQSFEPAFRNPHQKYCSPRCSRRQRKRNKTLARQRARPPRRCARCDKLFTAHPRNPKQRYCSHECRKLIFRPGMKVAWEFTGGWRARHLPKPKLSGVIVDKPGRVVYVLCAGMTHEVSAYVLQRM